MRRGSGQCRGGSHAGQWGGGWSGGGKAKEAERRTRTRARTTRRGEAKRRRRAKGLTSAAFHSNPVTHLVSNCLRTSPQSRPSPLLATHLKAPASQFLDSSFRICLPGETLRWDVDEERLLDSGIHLWFAAGAESLTLRSGHGVLVRHAPGGLSAHSALFVCTAGSHRRRSFFPPIPFWGFLLGF